MNIRFLTNDYLIAWNILFVKSITCKFLNLKRKLWSTYENAYKKIFDDKKIILKENKNYIPDNDKLYNSIIEKEDFKSLVKNADIERINYIKIWDKYKKTTTNFIKNIIRKDLSPYLCFIINSQFNVLETYKDSEECRAIIIGKKYLSDTDFLVTLIHEIIKQEINIKEDDNLGIKDAIIELAIINEYATLIEGNSHYQDGNEYLIELKKQIYPYWLMYLGIKKEDMLEYMKRDKITFQVNAFAYEKELINMNIEEFIEFVIRNKRYIIKTNKIPQEYNEEVI